MHFGASGWLRHDHGDLQWGHELRGQRRDVDHAEGNSGVVDRERSQLIRIRVGVRRVGDVHGDCNSRRLPGSGLLRGNGEVSTTVSTLLECGAGGWVWECDVYDGGSWGVTHTITAVYEGDDNFTTGTLDVDDADWVDQAATTSGGGELGAVRCMAKRSHSTAMVTVIFACGVLPTGTQWKFYDGETLLGTGTLDEWGEVYVHDDALRLLWLAPYHSGVRRGPLISAPARRRGSAWLVGQDATTATVLPLDPAVYEKTATLTVTVTADEPGSGVPTGTVDFYDGETLLGTGTLNESGDGDASGFRLRGWHAQ